jgi:hypothetical protein
MTLASSTRDSQPTTIADWRFEPRFRTQISSGYNSTHVFACDLHTATTITGIAITTTSCNPVS